MNPELEQLLAAMETRDNASPVQFADADAELERLLTPILERLSPIGRADFLRSLQSRYRSHLSANNRPSSLPPSA